MTVIESSSTSLLNKQIELEKEMTQCSIENYRKELEKAKQTGLYGCTSVATKLISRILDDFSGKVSGYLRDYQKGKAVRSTLAAEVINRIGNEDVVAFLTAKIILNSMWSNIPTTAM